MDKWVIFIDTILLEINLIEIYSNILCIGMSQPHGRKCSRPEVDGMSKHEACK